MDMKLEVDTEGKLEGDWDEHDVSHRAMHTREECPPTVRMAKDIARSSQSKSSALIE